MFTFAVLVSGHLEKITNSKVGYYLAIVFLYLILLLVVLCYYFS